MDTTGCAIQKSKATIEPFAWLGYPNDHRRSPTPPVNGLQPNTTVPRRPSPTGAVLALHASALPRTLPIFPSPDFRYLQCCATGRPVVWALDRTKVFSTKSLYSFLSNRGVCVKESDNIWKTKVPLKIKFFLWQIENDRLPTASALKKRGWRGSHLFLFMWAKGGC